jgi:hypothetical protein
MKLTPANQRTVDLHPTEWRSADLTPREPIFGPGLPRFIVGFAAWLLVSTAVHSVISPSHTQRHSLPPGAYAWSPEGGIQPQR